MVSGVRLVRLTVTVDSFTLKREEISVYVLAAKVLSVPYCRTQSLAMPCVVQVSVAMVPSPGVSVADRLVGTTQLSSNEICIY